MSERENRYAPSRTAQPRIRRPAPVAAAIEEVSQTISPEELARQAQRGSLPAFTRLVGMFETRLFNFLLRRTGNWADAEELTQETFVRAWQRLERYDDQWRFSTWLFTIGSRLAVSHHRAKKRVFSSDCLEYRSDHSPAPIDEAARREAKSPTWELAQQILTEGQHTALWLRYAEGLSMKEIAQVMGKSQVSVRVTLFRARDSLAAHISSLAEARVAAAAATPGQNDVKQKAASSEQSGEDLLMDTAILACLRAAS